MSITHLTKGGFWLSTAYFLRKFRPIVEDAGRMSTVGRVVTAAAVLGMGVKGALDLFEGANSKS